MDLENFEKAADGQACTMIGGCDVGQVVRRLLGSDLHPPRCGYFDGSGAERQALAFTGVKIRLSNQAHWLEMIDAHT